MTAMNDTTSLLGISAFARRVGLAPSALRFYDDCRILRPAHVDGSTGYRYYSPEQQGRARLLRNLRETGLPLAEIAVVLDGSEEEARELLERHLGTVRDQAESAQAAIAAVLRDFPGDGGRTEVRLGGVELASAVRQVVPAAARDDADDPVLGCVLVEVDEGEVRLVATDRYRLSVRVLKPLALEGAPACVLVPAAELVELGQWAARAAEVTLEIGSAGFSVRGGAEVREPATTAGEFPRYRDVLAAMAPPEHRVIVSRPALRDAVESCGDTGPVTLTFTPDAMAVSGFGGGTSATLPAVCQDAPPSRIGFDPAVLLPVLEASVGPDVLLEITEPTTLVVVRSADQGSFTTLVMPVALEFAG
jgi:DNA-binding transcriptional MerR regulator